MTIIRIKYLLLFYLNMQIEKLKNNDKIKIEKEFYEAIYIQEEVDYDSKTEKLRRYLEISLHKEGSASLHPTHALYYYPDNKEVFLLETKQEKPIVEHSRTRGGLISYHHKKKIDIKDIDIIS